MKTIFLVIGTQIYKGKKSKRAFVEPNERKAKQTYKDLAGWADREIIEVDEIMIGQILLTKMF